MQITEGEAQELLGDDWLENPPPFRTLSDAGTLAVLAWLSEHLIDHSEDNLDGWIEEADRLVRFAPRPDPIVLMMGPGHSISGQHQTLALDKPGWISWWVER